MTTIETQVVIIGAGATGLAIAAKLSAAQFNCLVVERARPGAGATFQSAGVLHSGARYAVADPELARRCIAAHQQALRIAGETITCRSDAYYVVLDRRDEAYAERLLAACERLGIYARRTSRDEVFANEPRLQATLIGAIAVSDFVQDPVLLVEAYCWLLERTGVSLLSRTSVDAAKAVGPRWHLRLRNPDTGETFTVRSDSVLIAAGGWTPHALRTFGLQLGASYVKGSMFVVNRPLVDRVVCRCAPPEYPDTAIPCYNTTLLGSTWRGQASPDPSEPDQLELKETLHHISEMLPTIAAPDIDHGYAGVRVMLGTPPVQHGSSRGATRRDYYLTDHDAGSSAPLISLCGGKLTLHTLMAEAAAELVCRKLGIRWEQHDHLIAVPRHTCRAAMHLGSLRRRQVSALEGR